MTSVKQPVVRLLLERDWAQGSLVEDVRRGLGAHPRSLPPKWLYDDRGSQLFDEITTLDEYYPTPRSATDEHADPSKALLKKPSRLLRNS